MQTTTPMQTLPSITLLTRAGRTLRTRTQMSLVQTLPSRRDATKTDSNECPSKFEAESLLSDVRGDERNVNGGTRGKKVDAYKQRVLDRAVRDVEEETYNT